MNEQIQTIYMYQESRYVYLATDNEKEWELVVPRFSLFTIVPEIFPRQQNFRRKCFRLLFHQLQIFTRGNKQNDSTEYFAG